MRSESQHAALSVPSAPTVPDRCDIESARDRIQGGVRRTPLLELAGDEIGLTMPARVLLKLELTQHTGSFKARGALNSVLAADPTPPEVVAVSGGNHGAAVAWAARRAGIAADVFVPSIATADKVELIRRYEGRAHVIDGIVKDAFEAGLAFAERHQVPLIHPYEQPATISGQGTLGLEIADQAPAVDTVLLGCGGGGLYAGVALALQGVARVLPVEPAGCPNLHAALAAGAPVPVDGGGVAADAMGPEQVGRTAFDLAVADGVEVPLITDDQIVAARRWLWQHCRVLAEPAACVGLAALLNGKVAVRAGETVVVVITGGNNTTLP